MDDFKKKTHEEFDKGFVPPQDWTMDYEEYMEDVKAFLDTTLDNLLVEVEKQLPIQFWSNYEYDPEYRKGWDEYRAEAKKNFTRFKGEEKEKERFDKVLEEIEAVGKLPRPWEDCICTNVGKPQGAKRNRSSLCRQHYGKNRPGKLPPLKEIPNT